MEPNVNNPQPEPVAPQPQPAMQPQPVQPQPVAQPQMQAQPMPAAPVKKKTSAKKVLIIIAIVFGVMAVLGATLRIIAKINPDLENVLLSTSTYDGDRYKLTYSSLWSKATYKTVDGSGVNGLSYDDGKGELIMNATTELGASIATESDRKELMNSFRNLYESHSEYEIYASYDMEILKDDIYYGRLDTKVNGYKRGSFIILASESKDILISFMTNTEMDVDEFANITLKLLKTIKID